MPKVNIAAKLADQVADPGAAKPAAAAPGKTQPARDPDSVRAPGGRHTPKYLRLERKDLRVRRDQAGDLIVLTRRLNRARGPGG